MIANSKELFLDKNLKKGGFYELSIQVCPSVDNFPIELYTDYIWSLKNVDGPFDNEFNKVKIDIENFEHNGILHLENKTIPFKTYNIRETEPIESGFNWFDICFYTSAIEKVFGEEYTTWTEIQNPPTVLKEFLEVTMKNLFKIYPCQLAMIDFEISGQYYLNDLKGEFENFTYSKFYIGKEFENMIAENNKPNIIIIN
jgi:hypothetical protein